MPSKMSRGAIAGIVIGVLVILLVLIVMAIILNKMRWHMKHLMPSTEYNCDILGPGASQVFVPPIALLSRDDH